MPVIIVFGLLSFSVLIAYGWVWNIIDLIHMHDGITGLLVSRVVGIFIVPLGAVLGIWG